MDQRLIDKLRADFKLVAAHFVGRGEWSGADERDAGFAIRDCIEADDRDLALCWGLWMARLTVRIMAEEKVAQVAPKAAARCTDCAHFSKPGRSDGACGGREDLARAYGSGHPLRVLPADGGVSCARFEPRGK